MTKEGKCLLGCLFAVNRLIEKGSTTYAFRLYDSDKWETIPWIEIREWIEKQYETGERKCRT